MTNETNTVSEKDILFFKNQKFIETRSKFLSLVEDTGHGNRRTQRYGETLA